MPVKLRRNGHVCPGFRFIRTPCITVKTASSINLSPMEITLFPGTWSVEKDHWAQTMHSMTIWKVGCHFGDGRTALDELHRPWFLLEGLMSCSIQ